MKSHQLVLNKAILDKVGSLLIMEDDVCFVDDFAEKVEKFLRVVPDDWDQLMIGGQHLNSHGNPKLVRPGVMRCTDCQRAHCHAIRGNYISKLHERLLGGGKYNGLGFNDWIMGGDPEIQLAHKVYAPQYFLAGQERGQSDIYGSVLPRKFWNPPERGLSVINLHAPASVVADLREHGLCTGHGCGRNGNLDQELDQIFSETKRNYQVRKQRLHNWITLLQWELASDPFFICTVAHPEASTRLVKEASMWKVYEIKADSVEDALAQLSRKYRKTPGTTPARK